MATERTGIVQALPAVGVRPRTPLLGVALLALWFGMLVPVFRSWWLPSNAPAADAQAIVAQLARLDPGVRTLGRTTAFLLGGCSCVGGATRGDAAPLAALPALEARRLGGRTTLDYPLVVLAPQGRLLYAGPTHLDSGCGVALPVSRLLPALLAATRPALIIQSTCSCTQE